MAETKGGNTNITTSGGTTGGTGETLTNTSTITQGGALSAGALSSGNTPDANLKNVAQNPSTTEGSVYKETDSEVTILTPEFLINYNPAKEVQEEFDKSKAEGIPVQLSGETLMHIKEAKDREAEILRTNLFSGFNVLEPSESAPEKEVTVRLNRVHYHAGKQYKSGDEITVSESTAQFLIDNRIGGIVK